jgi:hypothetical protein
MQSTNFEVIQGDSWSVDIYYTDAEDNPINISDYNVIAEVKDKPGGHLLCASISSGHGIELIDFPNMNNAIRVTFTGEQTAKFNLPKSAFQVQVVETKDTLLNGWFIVEAGVIDG